MNNTLMPVIGRLLELMNRKFETQTNLKNANRKPVLSCFLLLSHWLARLAGWMADLRILKRATDPLQEPIGACEA